MSEAVAPYPLAILLPLRPPNLAWSWTQPGARAFRDGVRREAARSGVAPSAGLMYGVLCCFVRGYDPARDPDADNLSKKVWDALTGVAYADDKQVRLRSAGVVDLPFGGGLPAVASLDLAPLPRHVADAIQAFAADDVAAQANRWLTYVEVGALRGRMFPFGLDRRRPPG